MVLVTSKLEKQGKVDPATILHSKGKELRKMEDIKDLQKFDWNSHYADSKQANMLLALYLKDKWSNTGSLIKPATVYTASPGMVNTGLWRYVCIYVSMYIYIYMYVSM